MAYEYNPQSPRFDIPNPHRIENIFLVSCAAASFVAALILLIDARTVFLAHVFVRFAKITVSAIGLLTLSVSYAFLVMQQMRFFFGRGQPADLVPSLRTDEYGFKPADSADRQIADAAALRQTLQQNAISYRVPLGPIDNLLYSLIRDLVYSPQLTQTRVRAQFRNLLGLAFLLVLFPVSLIGIANAAAVGWIGCFYFVLTIVLVLRPLAIGREAAARFSQKTVIGFIAAAIVAPVVFASFVPPNAYPLGGVVDVIPVTFTVLTIALIVTALVLRAGIATTVKPTQIAIAPHLETPSVNIAPGQIYTELARELQQLWEEQVPNRTYMRILPDVSGREGAFNANVIEETQPLPVDTEQMTFARALAFETTRWLLAVDVICTFLTVAGSALIAWGATVPAEYTAVIAGGAIVIVGAFGMRSGNEFWRRFEFTSRIYWVDWNGNYTRASTKIGALLGDRVHSEREVISIESMTLRVWVAEIDSVAFNTDHDRDLVAIRGLPDEASRLSRHLASFARDQGTITAPTSTADRDRLAAIAVLNADASPPPVALGDTPTVTIPLVGRGITAKDGTLTQRFCTRCGTQAQADAAYCAACGTSLS
jgi:hypothetical protein